MNAVALAIVVAAGVGDLVFVQALKPTSLRAALLLAAWLLTPCIVSAAWLARVRASRAYSAAAGIVTTVVAAGGASWLIRTIYIRPDAQGPIAVVLTPIYQMAALAVGAPVSAWLAARRWRRR